jgi:HAE1 family hydrophobic/amphiphilic exporter-1
MAVGITASSGFISQPLAIVVIGGLTTSTVLTLVIVPVLYTIVETSRIGRTNATRGGGRAARNNGRHGVKATALRASSWGHTDHRSRGGRHKAYRGP